MSKQFCATFRLASEDLELTDLLQRMKHFIFSGKEPENRASRKAYKEHNCMTDSRSSLSDIFRHCMILL